MSAAESLCDDESAAQVLCLNRFASLSVVVRLARGLFLDDCEVLVCNAYE